MKTEKQLSVIECIKSGYYTAKEGEVYCFINGAYRIMTYGKLPTGYTQFFISNHRRGEYHISERVYKHIFIYMYYNGTYPEGWEIDHEDGDINNTMPLNLVAKPKIDNLHNRIPRPLAHTYCERPIRGLEIANIRTLHKSGKSQSYIARELDLNRLSVRYTIKNIEAGKTLKFENTFE